MQIETMNFVDDGDTPNHPLWPMMIYQTALVGRSGMAESFEEMFQRNGWDNSGWRNGIFRFLHYHSNAHEVLGIADGTARVRFGGANGKVLEVKQGDAVLLPAGTGHQLIEGSRDLLVIGAYPFGPARDFMRSGEKDGEAVRRRIRSVPRPERDPVAGEQGGIIEAWPQK